MTKQALQLQLIDYCSKYREAEEKKQAILADHYERTVLCLEYAPYTTSEKYIINQANSLWHMIQATKTLINNL